MTIERNNAMSAIQLREGVWSVGVLNPALRVFDIVMESRYGTSYNAYLVTGGEKTALIEAVHKDYFEDLVSNIEEILPVEKLDYLIMNHTEPDHSGGVRALLDRCPNLTVLCSSSAKKFLTSIANEEFPCRVVKDGDTLDLGGKTLRFISAPLLHWPDSIFTWDFLGCHFCEPSMRDTDIHPEFRRYYEAELLNYFNCIFGPFKPAVLDGLDKMPAGVELVCTSHGPTLSQSIGYVKDCYRQWAAPAVRPGGKKTVGIIYCSAYGCTRALADAAAKALTADGMQVTTLDVVFGWTGEAAGMVQEQLKQLKFKTVEAPFKVCFTPTEADLTAMAEWARGVADLVKAPESVKPKAQKYICKLCGYIYDPETGDPDRGVVPGTAFEDMPKLWTCPLCGMDKAMFKPLD